MLTNTKKIQISYKASSTNYLSWRKYRLISFNIHGLLATILLCISTLSAAAPPDNPPPKNYPIPQFWNSCLNPIKVSMQQSSVIYSSRSQNSKLVAKLLKGEKVTVLEAVYIVINPGLAQVVGNFENNDLKLKIGTTVHVLSYDEDAGYANAWYDGKEVQGGLPIYDPFAFTVIKKPTLESWLKVKSVQFPSKIGWAIDSEAFKDDIAFSHCERAYEQ